MGGPVDYSTTASNNTSVGGVSIAEGMAPGNVNNGMRAMMADSRKWQLDWSGLVTAGAADAYTVTSNQGIAAYADGMRFSIRPDRNNTGAATLNIDGRGAKALRKIAGGALTALAADDLVADGVYDVTYDLAADVFVVVGFAGPETTPFTRTLLDDADAAAARTTLGLTIGTNVQAYDAALTTLAALPLVAGDLFYALGAEQITTLAKGLPFARLKMDSTGAFPEWGPINQGTLTSTASGGPYNANIPEGVSRIEVLFDQISLDSTGNWFVQIGPAAGVATTGYESGSSSRIADQSGTAGFVMLANDPAVILSGRMTLTLMDAGTNLWISDHTLFNQGTGAHRSGAGRIALSGTLQRFRLNFTAGNNPDGGQFRIQYE